MSLPATVIVQAPVVHPFRRVTELNRGRSELRIDAATAAALAAVPSTPPPIDTCSPRVRPAPQPTLHLRLEDDTHELPSATVPSTLGPADPALLSPSPLPSRVRLRAPVVAMLLSSTLLAENPSKLTAPECVSPAAPPTLPVTSRSSLPVLPLGRRHTALLSETQAVAAPLVPPTRTVTEPHLAPVPRTVTDAAPVEWWLLATAELGRSRSPLMARDSDPKRRTLVVAETLSVNSRSAPTPTVLQLTVELLSQTLVAAADCRPIRATGEDAGPRLPLIARTVMLIEPVAGRLTATASDTSTWSKVNISELLPTGAVEVAARDG